MSSVHIPRALSQRGRNTLEVEREDFEKKQLNSIQKAINASEAPVKEKHARVAIMGTYQERGCSMYWSIVLRLQLQGNPIICWKFCHVTHKLWRDGFGNAVQDSCKYAGFIKDLGKLWGHLKEGYGRLIAYYTKLLVQKLNFHNQNPAFPNNLALEEGQLEKICAADVNSYFEVAVDMLDYMDCILGLQNAVFQSLDMARANSMTASGQCRLAPLIQCIQDSCHLYDYIVKLLFKLHSSLPPDTLRGHRDRFHKQYHGLKKFYHSSGNLQYFKNLITVPSLPDEPPNFLHAAELRAHVTPVAVVPEEPEIRDDVSEADSSTDGMLIDTTEPFVEHNGAPMPPMPDEKDLLIESLIRQLSELREQVNRLQRELRHTQGENQMMVESLHNRIHELETELNELKQIGESITQENETLKELLKAGERNSADASRVTAMEKIAKTNDEKFKKMKEMYTRIREEHITLIRTNADAMKQMQTERREKDEAAEQKRVLSQELHELQQDKSRVEMSLHQSTAQSSSQLSAATSLQESLSREKQDLEEEIRAIEKAKSELENSLVQTRTQVTSLEKSMNALGSEKDDLKEQLMKELLELQGNLDKKSGNLSQLQSERDEIQRASAAQILGLQSNLDQSLSDKEQLERRFTQEILDYRRQLLVSAVAEGEVILRDAMAQVDNPHHSTITCTAEYLMTRAEPVVGTLSSLRDACCRYSTDKQALKDVIASICEFSHQLSDTIILGHATSQSAASVEAGEALSAECGSCGDAGLDLLSHIKAESEGDVPAATERVTALVKRLMGHAEELLPKVEDIAADKMGDMVDQEMQETTDAIEQAAARIAEMLAKSRQSFTGIQLEVNERILDSCTGLMLAIKIMVEKSKGLQREIVAQGRGTSSAKDFYKKHHRWTEGLISAAKAVGHGANFLVGTAEKVVGGEGKFEELVVCSQEIAASTTQLLVSSKVKAERGSDNLKQLSTASRGVTQATARVVACAKSAAQMTEEIDTMDFSKLTLHQAKRLEMESQVHVLTLESELEKERKQLSELRKTHYKLAGEAEGWDQEEEAPSSSVA